MPELFSKVTWPALSTLYRQEYDNCPWLGSISPPWNALASQYSVSVTTNELPFHAAAVWQVPGTRIPGYGPPPWMVQGIWPGFPGKVCEESANPEATRAARIAASGFGSAGLVVQAANITHGRTISTVLTHPVMVATLNHERASESQVTP